jgi:1,4-alpha-glucan branching enzyme
MPGDEWRQFANLRALYAYQYTRPGKPLLFMGAELGSHREWNHDSSLDWHLSEQPLNAGLLRFLADLGALYRSRPELWRADRDPAGFSWLDPDDRQHSILSYLRRDGERHLLVLLNLTPVPREGYRAGAPASGRYDVILSSDDLRYGGSGYGPGQFSSEPIPWQGQSASLVLTLPPLAALVLAPSS